jgi:hypothetical protein
MRPAFLLGFLLGLVPACKCEKDQPTTTTWTPPLPSSVAPVPSGFHADDAPFDADREHPFNRAHRALFGRKIKGSVSVCLTKGKGACLSESPIAVMGNPTVAQELDLGGDESIFFIGNDVEFLTEPKRIDEIDRALGDAIKLAERANPTARALLQSDAWERYDSITRELAGSTAHAEELGRVRRRIVELMRALALSSGELRSIPANLPELEVAYPELLSQINSRQGWIEVRTRANERSEEALVEGTRHAKQAGNRFAFRVLVRVPEAAGGADWLTLRVRKGEDPRSPLPKGTRLVLMGSPLAISKTGEVVPLPIVTLVETRVAPDKPQDSLATAPFDVLEGRRALFTRSERMGGGLERLAPDAAIPMGATCATNPSARVPQRAVCATCHAGETRLTGPMTHGKTVLEVEDDPSRAATTVAKAKTADPSFVELLRALRK